MLPSAHEDVYHPSSNDSHEWWHFITNKLIKTAVITTIIDKRDNHLFTLKNFMDVMTEVDLNDVIRDFITKKEFLVCVFGNVHWDYFFFCASLVILK